MPRREGVQQGLEAIEKRLRLQRATAGQDGARVVVDELVVPAGGDLAVDPPLRRADGDDRLPGFGRGKVGKELAEDRPEVTVRKMGRIARRGNAAAGDQE